MLFIFYAYDGNNYGLDWIENGKKYNLCLGPGGSQIKQ